MAQFIPLIIIGATTGVQMYAKRQEAKAIERQNKQAAVQEKDAARQREVERKRNLLKAIANRNAAAGAQGIAFSGGVAALAQEDISQAREDLLVDRANTARRVSSYMSAARQARRAGDLGMLESLLDGAAGAYNVLPGSAARTKGPNTKLPTPPKN